MNTERVFGYGFHDYEKCPPLDMWLTLFDKSTPRGPSETTQPTAGAEPAALP